MLRIVASPTLPTYDEQGRLYSAFSKMSRRDQLNLLPRVFDTAEKSPHPAATLPALSGH